MSTTKDIGSSIREQRKKRGVTQRQLAKELFVSASAVSKWENGDAIPNLYVLRQLADIFHISVSELLGAEDKLPEENVYKMLEEEVARVADNMVIVEEQTEQMIEAESNYEEQAESEMQSVSSKKRQNKYYKILIHIVIIAILGCISFVSLRSTTFRCKVVDEFYDDTSNYWQYNQIYHIVVEYNGVYSAEVGMEYAMKIRADYEQWLKKAEVIIITYFEEYTHRDAIYEAEFQSFLLPLPDSK